MRYLIVTSDYWEFLRTFHAKRPGLADCTYDEQARARAEEPFGVAEFYASGLRALGHEAVCIHANDETMQRAWARQHAHRSARSRYDRWRGRPQRWVEKILSAQVTQFEPDVLICLDMVFIHQTVFQRLRPHIGLLVGQHAAVELGELDRFAVYDLVLSSIPSTVETFRHAGIRSELLRIGFEASLLDRVPARDPRHDVSFVGSFFPGIHDDRVALIERLCEEFDGMRVWAHALDATHAGSIIQDRNQGPVWGWDMFRVLRESRVTINHHGLQTPHANNCRLYEATGIGTCLVTDWKPDLGEMFESGIEVAAYEDVDSCVDLVRWALDNPKERERMAAAGQARTLRDHTYAQRTEELAELVEAAIRQGRQR